MHIYVFIIMTGRVVDSPEVHPCTGVSQGAESLIIYIHLITYYIHIYGLFVNNEKCRHHQQGRWQARIGRVAGNKDLYLGTFSKYIYLGLLSL